MIPAIPWSHDIKTFANEIGAFGNATINVMENGPLRATTRITTTYGASTLTIDWTIYAGSRNLEAKVKLDWHEHLKMLKFSFPVDIESPTATYETPYGHIVRTTNGEEEPGQRWIDLSGNRNGATYGLTVINDAKYGYNVLGNDMRISIARSAVYAQSHSTCAGYENRTSLDGSGNTNFPHVTDSSSGQLAEKQYCQDYRGIYRTSYRNLPGNSWRINAKIRFFPCS